ncbi:MAG: ribbon-helix-helix protein, CopG family [Jiangellaceae bacterium]
MRTTVRLDDDVAAYVEQLRRQRHLSLSEAVNELARAGLRARPERTQYRQRTRPLKMRIDVSNVAEALDLLDDMDRTA